MAFAILIEFILYDKFSNLLTLIFLSFEVLPKLRKYCGFMMMTHGLVFNKIALGRKFIIYRRRDFQKKEGNCETTSFRQAKYEPVIPRTHYLKQPKLPKWLYRKVILGSLFKG